MRKNDKQARLLFIDDNPESVAVLINRLENLDFNISVASDGEEGIELAQSLHPDIIMLDLFMPGMDGYETCRQLKLNESTSDIPVIFMTAHADQASMLRGFEVGGVDYVIKPVQFKELLARINKHLAIQK
jgi:DNA-binding response OmpR family regulator